MVENSRSMVRPDAAEKTNLWRKVRTGLVGSRGEWIHWGLVAFAFLLPFPLFGPDGRNVLLYLLLGVWLFGHRSGDRFTNDQTRLAWALIIYLLVACLSITASPDAKISLRDFQRVPLNGLVLFLVLANGQGDPVRLHRYLLALVCASGLISAYGVLGLIIGRAQLGGVPTSVYAWKNELGYLLAVSLTIVVWKILTTRDRVRQSAWAVLALIQLVLLLLSYTRAALVAVIVSTILLAIAFRRFRFLMAGGAALGAALAVSGPQILARYLTIAERSTYLGGTLSGRVDLWWGTLAMIQQRPLLGYGYGWELFARTARAFADQTGDLRATLGPHAHNLFLEAAFETGLFGVAALCLLGGTVAWVLVNRCRVKQSSDERSRAIAVVLFALYAVVLVISLTDYLLGDRLGALGWTFFSLTGALASQPPRGEGTQADSPGRSSG